MKHMTCVNHKVAQQVCVTPDCKAKCAYICFQGVDSCRDQHQRCSVAFLNNLVKKSGKLVAKARDFHVQKMMELVKFGKKAVQSIQSYIEYFYTMNEIHKILDEHGLLDTKQKSTLADYMFSKSKIENDLTVAELEKNLSNLQIQIAAYLLLLKQSKQARMQAQQLQNKRQSKTKQSKVRSKVVAPSPVKSSLIQNGSPLQKISQVGSKVKQKRVSGIKQLQSPIQNVSSLRKHVPKPPFFSKITNDVQTINTFFYHKFADVRLLYRASQNEFLVSKFHDKCDGIPNTITLLLTQHDKVIGGFTSLPWRSGGGQWYPDEQQRTFLFNLSSGQRYPLVNKQKAIWCSQAFGPSFGYPDLQIADKAFYNSNSCANFPQCFNNGNYTLSSGSTQMFCGSKNGYFKIKQWEVYELTY